MQRPSANASKLSSALDSSTNTNQVNNPLDQVASANIALQVAKMTNLPETTAISNQSQSQQAELAQASTANNVIAKPQVVETAIKTRQDITTYTAVAGDTIASVAAKFGLTTNSIIWSNGLSSTSPLTAGAKLNIPPVNGVVYNVASGDTTSSLATKFNASEAEIIAYNDAEIGGITNGEQILIPNGQIKIAQTVTPTYTASWGGPQYGFNGYDYGYCTWYVASQVGVPSNWGNASSWAYYAGQSGWGVSTSPTTGSIAQTANAAGGQGHVAVVQDVSPDGSQVLIKDMNNYGDGGGWGKVGSAWVPVSTFQHYITK